MRNGYLFSGHPTLQDPAHVPEEFDDPLDHKALAFQYVKETYGLLLDMHDKFAESNQAMEKRYSEYSLGIKFPKYIFKTKRTKKCRGS